MRIISNKIAIPPLIRKQLPICPGNIKIIVNSQKVSELQNIKPQIEEQQQKIIYPTPGQTTNRKEIIQNSQQKLHEVKIKKPKAVRYIAEAPSPENTPKIFALRGKGKGRILAIIGNGPSINEIPLERLKYQENVDTLSINHPDPRLWPTTYWSFYDPSQLKRHKDLIDSYDGTMFNSTAIKMYKSKSIKFNNIHGMAFSKDLTKGLCIGKSSCYAAMQIALWMGYEKIFLFGVDMNADGIDGNLHFYGTNPDVNPEVRKVRFKNEAEFFGHAAERLTPEERIMFYFCSSYNNWGFTTRFNHMDHKKSIDFISSTVL